MRGRLASINPSLPYDAYCVLQRRRLMLATIASNSLKIIGHGWRFARNLPWSSTGLNGENELDKFERWIWWGLMDCTCRSTLGMFLPNVYMFLDLDHLCTLFQIFQKFECLKMLDLEIVTHFQHFKHNVEDLEILGMMNMCMFWRQVGVQSKVP